VRLATLVGGPPPRDHNMARVRVVWQEKLGRLVGRQGRFVASASCHHVLGQDKGMLALVTGADAAGPCAVSTAWEMAVTLGARVRCLPVCWCQLSRWSWGCRRRGNLVNHRRSIKDAGGSDPIPNVVRFGG
jgi:hypothetical protein